MAAPDISALPTAPQRLSSPETFSSEMDAFLAALPTLRAEINALASYLNDLAILADGGIYSVQSSTTDTTAGTIPLQGNDADFRNLSSELLGINGGYIGCETVVIADDAAASIAPLLKGGIAIITVNNDSSYPTAESFGFVYFDAGATPSCQSIHSSNLFGTTTGILDGTTGADTYLTVSAHTDGKLYIENRTGSSRTVTIHMFS